MTHITLLALVKTLPNYQKVLLNTNGTTESLDARALADHLNDIVYEVHSSGDVISVTLLPASQPMSVFPV